MDNSDTSIVAAIVAAAAIAKPIAEAGCELAKDLLGEPLKVAGGMIADQIYAWQLGNRLRILSRAKQIMQGKNIEARQIATGFLLPLLDCAGNVDNSELQELWANLLVSGVSDDKNQHPMFSETLSRLRAADSRLFRDIAKYEIHPPLGTETFSAADSGLLVAGRLTAVGLISGLPRRVTLGEGPQRKTCYLSPYGWQFAAVVMPELRLKFDEFGGISVESD